MRIIKAVLMLNCPERGLIPRSECKPKNVEGGCQHLHYYTLSTYDIECGYEPFSKPCRFGDFCTDEGLYTDCVKDKRVKSNWICWRDGIMKDADSSTQTKKTEGAV